VPDIGGKWRAVRFIDLVVAGRPLEASYFYVRLIRVFLDKFMTGLSTRKSKISI